MVKIFFIPLFLMCLIFPNFLEADSDKDKRMQYLLSKVPRISAEMALLMYKSGKVIIADAMNKRTYKKYHILGSINLPGDGKKDLDRISMAKLPISKNKKIIVYCD